MVLHLVSDEVEEYSERHSSAESALFQSLARETYATAETPQMQVGHLEGSFLRMLVRISSARRVLEIGTFTGYSALAMAEALPEDGRLVTCDMDPVNTRIAHKYWDQSPHGKKIQFKLGPALETLHTLNETFDLAFIDADKTNLIHYWEACISKVRKGGLIVVDNVLWSGRVLKPADPTTEDIHRFNQHAARDLRMETVMLPLRDGITLAWKK